MPNSNSRDSKTGVRTLGVISDTHGLLRPEVLPLFKGVDLILHGGDIGSLDVLEQLRSIAPVVAVRGNNDNAPWAREIPDCETMKFGRVRIYMLHDLKTMKETVALTDFHVVVSGHSHRPLLERRNGVLFVNPGSAGPRRFKLPVSVARLNIQGSSVKAKLIGVAD